MYPSVIIISYKKLKKFAFLTIYIVTIFFHTNIRSAQLEGLGGTTDLNLHFPFILILRPQDL